MFSSSFRTACGMYFRALQTSGKNGHHIPKSHLHIQTLNYLTLHDSYKDKITKAGKGKAVTGHSPQIDPFVVAKLSAAHVTMISYDLSYMFWRHVFFTCVYKSKLTFFCIPFGLQLLPFSCCKIIKYTSITFE